MFSKSVNKFLIFASLLSMSAILTLCLNNSANAQNDKIKADMLFNEGIKLYEKEDYKASKIQLEKVLNLYESLGLEKEIADTKYNLGESLYILCQYDKAKLNYESALSIYKKLDLNKETACALIGLGRVANVTAQYDDEKLYLEQAIDISRKFGFKKEEAYSLYNMGFRYCAFREFGKAMEYLKQALEIYKKLGLEKFTGMSFRIMGWIEYASGYYDEALRLDEQALDIFNKIGYKGGKAAVYVNLGLLYDILGQFDKALIYYEQAMAIQLNLGLENDRARSLYLIGSVYNELGQYGKAITYIDQSLDIMKKLGLENNCAAIYGALADMADGLGQYDKAIEYLNKELAIHRKLDIEVLANEDEMNIANIRIKQGNLSDARSILEKYGYPLRWGIYYLKTGDYENAEKQFKQALEHLDDYYQYTLANKIGLGLAQESLGKLNEASETFSDAIDLVEESRMNTPPGDRMNFFEAKSFGFSRLDAYEGLIRVLNKLGRSDDAFLWSEHIKARTLIEAIARTPYDTNLGIPDSLHKKEINYLKCIADINNQIDNAFKSGNKELRGTLEQNLKKITQEQEVLITQLRREYPEYASIQYPQPVRSSEVTLKKNEVMLEYEVTNSVTFIFVVRSGKVQKVIESKVTRKELNQMVEHYRLPFVDIGKTGSYASFTKLDIPLGNKLYNLLLKDALTNVKENEKVLIVPDEMLCVLPFEALIMKLPKNGIIWKNKGHGSFPAGIQYIGDNRVFSYWQSASSLTILRNLHKKVGGDWLLVIADPVFNKTDDRVKNKTRIASKVNNTRVQFMNGIANPELKYTGWENFTRLEKTKELVERLNKIYGKKLTALTGFDAKESELISDYLGKYGDGIIFATHGIIDEKMPYFQQAAIVLSNPEFTGELAEKKLNPSSKIDGFLTMNKVMRLKMPTEIAAALACVTGIGSMVRGEGVMNLGRAFQYAGARSALISLWTVESESTNLLGEQFFDTFKHTGEKDSAILSARRMLRKKGYEHPYFWSGFILVGERDSLSRHLN